MNTTHPLAALAAALLAVPPAAAQSFHPEVAGPLFCNLRHQGVPLRQATSAAISAAWDQGRPDTKVRRAAGHQMDSDVAGLTDYVLAHCPHLF